MEDFINLDKNNIDTEHLCCIIRTKVKHPGVEAKRLWLKKELKHGHVFRKLNVKEPVFIEYAPLENSWVPIEGKNYYYIYCLWVSPNYKNKGYGTSLMNYVINDAKLNHKSGICMLGSAKQKAWLSDSSFAKKFGFKVIDKTNNDYELLALSFDEDKPSFKENAKQMKIENKELTIYYDYECPFIYDKIESIKSYAENNKIKLNIILIDTIDKAKKLPCVFNNFAVFYNGDFITVNILDSSNISKIIKIKE